MKQNRESKLALPSNDVAYTCFRLAGDGEYGLLVNNFNQKSFEQMLASMTGYALPKEPKDLANQFESAFVRNEDGVECLPSRWIRSAMESATPRSKKMVAATVLRSSVFVMGHSLPILDPSTKKTKGKAELMAPVAGEFAEQQIDIVRVGNFGSKKPDVRARPYYREWAIEIAVRYFPDQIGEREVAWALDAAGKFVGLCEWRPEKSGSYGTFRVEPLPASELDRIVTASACHMPRLQVPPWLSKACKTSGAEVGEVLQTALRKGKRPTSQKNGAAHA
jgi:hypothetical protein